MTNMALVPALSLEDAVERYNDLGHFVKAVLRDGIDFGLIPGTAKPTLLKPGAEKLCALFALTPQFTEVETTEDWTGKDHGNEPFFYYKILCQLTKGGLVVGSCIASCNSWEERYRYRTANRSCPECGSPAILKSRDKPEWFCWKKKGGCGFTFPLNDKRITDQQEGRVPNPNIFDQVNTFVKQAQKRCLGSGTTVLFKTGRSICRSTILDLVAIYDKSNDPIYLPGPDGTWREVLGIERVGSRPTKRIELSDGFVVFATPEHRFPTERGLLEVSEMVTGDRFIRSRIQIEDARGALNEIGWVCGLFIADGNYNTETGVKFTLNSDEEGFVSRIEAVAKLVGSTVTASIQPNTHTLRVGVNGPGFSGIIRQFVTGDYSSGKHLHRNVWSQGMEFLKFLISGYLDGDGSLLQREGKTDVWNIGFTQENFALADDLRSACSILGYRISLKHGISSLYGKEYQTWVGWIQPNETQYIRKNLEQIVSISESRDRIVYDIEVDGDHLYCLSNGIQTHNSMVGATLIAANASEYFTQDMEDIVISGDWKEVSEKPEEKKVDNAKTKLETAGKYVHQSQSGDQPPMLEDDWVPPSEDSSPVPAPVAVETPWEENGIIYRKKDGAVQLKFGTDWRPTLEQAKLSPAATKTVTDLFKDGFEMEGHLNKHFGMKKLASLNWQQVMALLNFKKKNIKHPLYYVDKVEKKIEEKEPEVGSLGHELALFFNPGDDVPDATVNNFVAEALNLPDPKALKVLFDAGLNLKQHGEELTSIVSIINSSPEDYPLLQDGKLSPQVKELVDHAKTSAH